MEDAVRDPRVEANRREYGADYHALTFPSPQAAAAAERRRAELLGALSGRAETGCGGSKLDMRRLSPGCRRCVEGSWSCLFINGRCNADCFYCPTRQDEIGLPTTNTVNFRHPADYGDYLEHFGFTGASLSGGEPLLTPGRSLGFLRYLKRRFGDRLHTWLYTNGTLATPDLLRQLGNAGLDEIRFDIGATAYHLKRVRHAVGVIPTVTVEIPAVPDEIDLLRAKMVEMADAGIAHLNLHQLRLTPHSLPRLKPRGYTYLHGDKVTVLESELTALELILHGLDRNIDLPVNYCSFVYKNRYQKAAARRRGAAVMSKSHEGTTESGLIRSMSLLGEEAALQRQLERFVAAGVTSEQFSLQPGKGRLLFAPQLHPLVEPDGFELGLVYSEAAIREGISYRHPFKEIRFKSGRKVFVERGQVTGELALSGNEVERFFRRYLGRQVETTPEGGGETWRGIDCCERIPTGLQRYF